MYMLGKRTVADTSKINQTSVSDTCRLNHIIYAILMIYFIKLQQLVVDNKKLYFYSRI